MIHKLRNMIGSNDTQAKTERGWVWAVPLPFYGGLLDRIIDAIEVIKGNAFAVFWPRDGELEETLEQRVRSKTGYTLCKCDDNYNKE